MFRKRLHTGRPTFDKIDMAYIKTPCPNRDIVKVLKINIENMDIAMTAPVGQNQIHINLIHYKHRCTERVIDTAYYNLL